MKALPYAAAYAAPRWRERLWTFLGYLVVGLVALPLRVLDLGGFLTVDEINYWIDRSQAFLHALRAGDYAATAITGHPGVTTMWLGGAGALLRDTLLDWGLLHDGSFPTKLAFFRLPVALTHVLGVLLGYALLRRLLPGRVAILAALLWAADPFIIGYSRVLHVDALAATFGTLSLLSACAYWHHTPRRWLLIGSGICAALAILSKVSALVLLPVVGLVALGAALRPPTTDDRRPTTDDRRPTNHVTPSPRHPAHPVTPSPRHPLIWPLLIWGAAAALTALLLWPALWAAPMRVYDLLQQTSDLISQPHDQGNFFLGHDEPAPGPLFYPVALALRLTPWALLGLLLLLRRRVWALVYSHADLVALACFIVLFIGALSLSPKKFNRYLIPAFPAIDILAAVGLSTILDFRLQILDWEIGKSKIKHLKSKMLLGVVSLVALANAAWWHPYGIAYYDPLLGGAQAGASTFLTGWGEGLDQVAAWLNQQPDITGVVTASTSTVTLRPYLRRGVQADTPEGTLPDHAGYVVVYIRHAQQGGLWPPFDQFYQHATPLQTIRIHGITYAWIYQVPPTVEQLRPAAFGTAISLYGFDLDGLVQRGGSFTLKLTWEALQRPSHDYTLFAHLIGPDGRRYAQADVPYTTSRWQPGRFVTTELPLDLPKNAPGGIYRLFIGLYDPDSGQRLLLSNASVGPALDGANALMLEQAQVR
ncbi:MAG: glycosyltransferase family 39 protein [Roseiflexaceae bacterium]